MEWYIEVYGLANNEIPRYDKSVMADSIKKGYGTMSQAKNKGEFQG
ncbi:hypothetical protein ACIQZG_14755 [Lysinibacillus sp. NPDC096418]